MTDLSSEPGTASFATARRALLNLADADTTAIAGLAAGEWPTKLRPRVNLYIAALDEERHTLDVLAAEPTLSSIRQHATSLAALLTAVKSTQSGLLRATS